MEINTKILMTSSALFLGIIGILLSFLTEEIIDFLKIEPNYITILFFQLLSALYLGFGILNWMSKGTLIGGIYNRPIALANLMNFGVGSIAMVKIANTIQIHSKPFLFLTIVYVIFAILYFIVFRRNPSEVEKNVK